jgi:uncharacterized protein YdiU (UPF0061 family)
MTVSIEFDNSYARLPPRFYAPRAPVAVALPRLIHLNDELATWLGLDPAQLGSPEGVAMLAGNRVPSGAQPIAQAYAGHQFGHFVPQLGDGRAVLLGEVIARDGARRDIQLKGAGPTVFSRSGDGRAALGPVLREYIVSEAMHALGIPTTRALAAVLTGEMVMRDAVLPGAVLARVAASHIRVGTFEYFAAQGDTEAVRILADHVIDRHYPHIARGEDRFRALLEAVAIRQADLVAHWLAVGFIHGVMNTDNTSIAGETIDYGPCAFMDAYDPGAVFSAIDHMGRYAYANQPRIAQWNLARLAEALLPLLAPDQDEEAIDQAQQALAAFAPRFALAHTAALRGKIGLTDEQPGDAALVQDLLNAMAARGADFTLTFRRLADLADLAEGPPAPANPVPGDPIQAALDEAWLARWRTRLASAPAGRGAALRARNPLYIPRNHLIEAAIGAALRGDYAPFESLLDVLRTPFTQRAGLEHFATPPRPDQRVLQTFCGT